MILFSTKNCKDFTNSSSGILSVAHHPAVFFIHAGTIDTLSDTSNVNISGFSTSL